MKKISSIRLLLAAASAGAITVVAWACGGGYEPEGILTIGDHAVISPLRTTFTHDFEKAFGNRLAPKQTEEMPGLDRPSVVNAVLSTIEADQRRQGLAFDREGKTTSHPLELSLYLASLETDGHEGIPLCEQILALPVEKRRNLTALAHYRLARLLMKVTVWEDMTPERARLRMTAIRSHLRATKQAVKEGHPDICRISLQCDGWIAYSQSMIAPAEVLEDLGLADFGQALRTYLSMNERGESNGSNSAFLLIRKLAREYAFDACAKDPDLRRLMTIYLCAGGVDNPYFQLDCSTVSHLGGLWLMALEKAGVEPGDDALRIANLQYSHGEWDKCAATLRLLPSDDPMAALLRSRVNLRQDNLLGAIASLTPAIHRGGMVPFSEYMGSEINWSNLRYDDYFLQASLGDQNKWTARVRGELGVLLLSNQEYVRAMEAFYYSGNERDAAYVGECLLSIDELKQEVDKNWIRPLMKEQIIDYPNVRLAPVEHEIRDLLARRLFRAGRMDEALAYFSPTKQKTLRTYLELRKKADRWSLDQHSRADAYWRAALIMAKQGDELTYNTFGHYWRPDTGRGSPDRGDLQPNWHEKPDQPNIRLIKDDWEFPNKYVCPSDDEVRRNKSWHKDNMVNPDRSHRLAKYAAVDLIVRAVSYLPDNDVRGSLMLQYAGDLIKYVEPKAAQPAYRILATRFKKTPLGKHAWNRHWFSHDNGSDDPDLLSK